MSNTPRAKSATPKLDALQASVPDNDLSEVTVAGRTFQVKAVLDWPASAVSNMQTGNYEPWFKGVVVDGVRLWTAQEPTMREMFELIEQLDVDSLLAGMSLGK